jgi:hypothetical protein
VRKHTPSNGAISRVLTDGFTEVAG